MNYDEINIPEQLLGTIYVEIDGFHVFNTPVGFMTAHRLREVADLLDKLNEPWQKDIDKYHEHLKKEESEPFVSNYHLCEACGHNCSCGCKTGCDLCTFCREKLDNGEPIY